MSYSFSWTQPYNISMNPLYNATQVELARLDELEKRIIAMTEYPDAEKIIAKIKGV